MRTVVCPCQSGKSYAACCQPFHDGLAAPTAVALMRSRYSAYALGLPAYLLSTWHDSMRPPMLDLETSPRPKWIGLQIRHVEPTGEDSATVEFVARYKVGGRGHRLHETSRFRREGACWYYVDGDVAG